MQQNDLHLRSSLERFGKKRAGNVKTPIENDYAI
jgi:hypothetical protein